MTRLLRVEDLPPTHRRSPSAKPVTPAGSGKLMPSLFSGELSAEPTEHRLQWSHMTENTELKSLNEQTAAATTNVRRRF